MAKTATIILRVEPASKARIEAAAGRLGKSVTTFMLEAALSAAGKAETMPRETLMPRKPSGKGACPTYFLACCHEAAQGGESGYAVAGHTLAGGLASAQPYELEDAAWYKELDRLGELLTPPRFGTLVAGEDGERDAAVWSWFEEHLPRCTALIPARRRKQFLAGIYWAAEDETIGLNG